MLQSPRMKAFERKQLWKALAGSRLLLKRTVALLLATHLRYPTELLLFCSLGGLTLKDSAFRSSLDGSATPSLGFPQISWVLGLLLLFQPFSRRLDSRLPKSISLKSTRHSPARPFTAVRNLTSIKRGLIRREELLLWVIH